MDRRQYWAVIRHHWFLFLLGTALTASLAAWGAYRADDVYEASGTFLVRPRATASADAMRAIDILNRSMDVGSTYAFIARSDLVAERALEGLEGNYAGLAIRAELVPGTNVVEISARGENPQAVRDLARAVGRETVEYVGALLDAFELVPLDVAQVPDRPVAPNRSLTVSLGVLAGIAVGASLAMLAHTFDARTPRSADDRVIDPYTGAYSSEFFDTRFRQELARANRRHRTFTLGMIRTVAESGSEEGIPPQNVMRQIAFTLQGKLSYEDVLAYLGDGVFAIILLEQDDEAAGAKLEQWRDELESLDLTDAGVPVDTRFSLLVTSYGNGAGATPSEDETLSAPV